MDASDIRSYPARITRLGELALDLSWSWNQRAREVFRRLDYTLWRTTAHNPCRMLRLAPQERLEEVARDSRFLELYDDALANLDRVRRASGSWWCGRASMPPGSVIAYFSAEFGVHQSLPIYAGGLGVLAGDHCKEACDLGIPLVGIGFLYPMGYFHQRVNADGWQVEAYERLRTEDVAVQRAICPGGKLCYVEVPMAFSSVRVAIWRVSIGCVTLLLLDTDVEENTPWDRELSARLYVSEHEARVRQEIVLGIGGVRALQSLGYKPAVWHLNEGHAAFVIFERIRQKTEQGHSLTDALREVRASTVFTTHTPVPAGHDAFNFNLVDHLLSGYWQSAGDRRNTLLALAGYDDGGGRLFNMTALALRGAGAVNAVSRQHREVTWKMFSPIWCGSADEPPLQAITNGIHIPTWIAPALSQLFDHHLGPDWIDHQDEVEFWDRVLLIPDEDIWKAHQALKQHLLAFIRERARERWTNEKVNSCQVVAAGPLLDLSVPTICFARRFTSYKRPNLIFHDLKRITRLLTDSRRPIQIIFAGKAHPADDPGKRALQQVYLHALDLGLAGRVAFVDDYDLHVAHFLVQGSDIWLNNPLKPLEACGTSGMKAAINGVPHLSAADGWWPEAYNGKNGWMIDSDPSGGDAAEAECIYRLLEEQIIPAYYEMGEDGVPRRWVAVVKESIRTVAPRFSARRMLKDYATRFYCPIATRSSLLLPS